ncbi:MAG: C39 family peptidase [Candidatus Sericytochromatia bacterium]|nr:C39 family peptidase [Candidatus Sericytochromatia bacterium]
MVSGIPSGTGPLPALPALPPATRPLPAGSGSAAAPLTAALPAEDQLAVQPTPASADFAPTQGASFPDTQAAEAPPLPSLDEPVTGVLRGEALEARLQALQQEVGTQLQAAQGRHQEALGNLQQNGLHNDLINNVLRHQHAIDRLNQVQTILQQGGPDAVRQLQDFIKSTATDSATGADIGVDNQYGPTTDRLAVARVREPDSTYIERDLSHQAQEAFVYQYGEIGENGTAMEAQANCGPASMAMVIERLGGDAPSMQQIRREAGAPTGNRQGTYGLNSDQVERGLQNVLGEQGIAIETNTQIFRSRDVEGVTNAMREALAAGEQVILLTANLESGGRGHYVVVTEVRDDGSFVVDDPQNENGQGQVHTAEELAAGMRRRAQDRDTRIITVARSATD